MPEKTRGRPRKGISIWAYGAFLAYFAAILPLFLWGLWTLVTGNTVPLPNSTLLVGLPSTALKADTLVFLAANQQTKLVLDQGELLWAVMLAGGIGSYIHGVNSFVTYVGNRSFVVSWMPWYVLRPFMGIAMAVIFYVVVRGGVLVMSGGVSAVDPYAMMTVAALAGMFSKQASDKLAEVFDTLFRSRADDERADKLEKPELKLGALNPAQLTAGSTDTVITATGTGFVADSVVRFDKEDRDAEIVSATELTFILTAADLEAAGEHTVAIFNPAAGGVTSNEVKLSVVAVESGGGVTTVPIPAVIKENAEGEVEVVSAADETAAVSVAAGQTEEAEAEETVAVADENGAVG
jgi:hypothetical protein